MKKNWFLLSWFNLVSILSIFGQEPDATNDLVRRHFVFNNITHLFDPSGATLQFGFNYQCSSWIDLQLELGFVSDNLNRFDLPFEEYAGFRVRPQIRFSSKRWINRIKRPYLGLILSYQRLNFKENNNFNIENNFFQNITYNGIDQTYAWYIIGGYDVRFRNRFIASYFFGLGKVWINTKADEGSIPENAILINDCVVFCSRNDAVDRKISRPGILFEIRLGYMF